MRDGCDIVWIDRCSGSPVIRSEYKDADKQHPVVTRQNGGTTYVVTFPRSGATIKTNFVTRTFQIGTRSCGWSGCTAVPITTTTQWMDIWVTAPGSDFGLQSNGQPRTRGLCGSYDNNRNNDPTRSSGFLIANGQSLFDRVPTCTPLPAPIVDYSRCTYVSFPIPIRRKSLISSRTTS
jgi:hypothetical protein